MHIIKFLSLWSYLFPKIIGKRETQTWKTVLMNRARFLRRTSSKKCQTKKFYNYFHSWAIILAKTLCYLILFSGSYTINCERENCFRDFHSCGRFWIDRKWSLGVLILTSPFFYWNSKILFLFLKFSISVFLSSILRSVNFCI